MRAVILIPTYNEALNILELLTKLSPLQHSRQFDVVVIDDNSPDDTAEIVDNLHLAWVRTLKRESKAGLGAAYRA